MKFVLFEALYGPVVVEIEVALIFHEEGALLKQMTTEDWNVVSFD